jgi:hypothetical protein
VLTDNSDLTSKILFECYKAEFVVVQYNEGDLYSNHFTGLRTILKDQFLYMQEDFFLVSEWNPKELCFYRQLMVDNNYSLIRLTPSGSFRSKAYLDYYLKNSKVCLSSEKFKRVDYLSSLPACMQPTFWKTSVFIDMHENLQVENLRDEWSVGYRKYFKENRIQGLATVKTSLPYLEVTAVRRGKWNFTDFQWGLVLQAILKDHGVNPLDRGISTYKFQVSEKQSNIFVDFWRRLRYGGF